jgi:hypothetical protein
MNEVIKQCGEVNCLVSPRLPSAGFFLAHVCASLMWTIVFSGSFLGALTRSVTMCVCMDRGEV